VYVADPGNERIARLWGDGTFLSELGGPGQLGGAELSGAGSVAVTPAGAVYVADANHNRVLLYSPGGSLTAKWGAGAGDGSSGDGQGEFNHPAAVALDGEGDVYVADSANNRIVKLAAAGTVLGEWGSYGTGDGRFREPAGVAVDGAGNVYVLDRGNNRVQVFDSSGRFLAKWGVRGTGLGEFSQPSAIAVDCNGDVYVADTNNNRVERFDPVAANPTGCAALGGWPPPLDVAPVLGVTLPRRAGVLARGALALGVSCRRGCQIRVTATLSPSRRRSPVELLAAARSLPPKLTGHVRLRLSTAALRRLRRELERTRTLTARVKIVATGPTGLRTTLTRTYAVTR
jgi:DNA-binding beta-propeller fold protein YncE